MISKILRSTASRQAYLKSIRFHSQESLVVNAQQVFANDMVPEYSSKVSILEGFDKVGENPSLQGVLRLGKRNFSFDISQSEISAGTEAVCERPEILETIFPSYSETVSHEQFLGAIDVLRTISNDRTLMQGALEQIPRVSTPGVEFYVSHLDKTPQIPAFPDVLELDGISSAWEDLVSQYRCVICQDLLACPCIVSCSHSYCGSCLQSLLNTCVCMDDANSVLHHCCVCKSEIRSYIYERLLDEAIVEKVALLPNCLQKREWEQRRQKFRTVDMENYQKEVSRILSRVNERFNRNNSEEGVTMELVSMVLVTVVVVVLTLRSILTKK